VRCNYREGRVLARSALAQGMKMAERDYLQGVHWQMVRRWLSATIGEECAGTRCNNGRVQLFTKGALAEEVKMAERD